MRKTTQTITFTIAIILLLPLISQTCTAQTPNDTFSIVWISDTQYLSESHPADYTNLCQWIVQNKDTYNVQMVIHTGDIVNAQGNATQWKNANQSMSLLTADGIPYCWDAGNHDYNSTCWIGDQYAAFNPQTFQSNPYWVGSYDDGRGTAVSFNASGQQWLIVNLAFYANDSALQWTNSLLDTYPQSHVIVATHAYINRQCQYDAWATNLKTAVLDTHANVFLTLSGHYHQTSGNRTRVGGRDELLFNQQDADDQRGAASARILTFNVPEETVEVKTFDLLSNTFLQDSNNNFGLSTTFRNDAVRGNSFFMVLTFGVAVVLVVVAVLMFILRRRSKR